MARRPRNPDEPREMGAEDFARGVRIPNGPAALTTFLREDARKRRGPQKAATKLVVTIRLDREIVDAYRHTGRGWQSRMNDDLAKSAKRIRVVR